MKRKKKKNHVLLPISTAPFEGFEGYHSHLPETEFERLKNELAIPLLPAIRINPLKTAPGFAELLEKKYHWRLNPIPFCPSGFRVKVESGPSVSSTLEHKLGLFYIQEAASMLPVQLFSFQDQHQPLVLDIAASPGGKTTHLLSQTADRGIVFANDSSQGRIQALRIVLQGWGAVNQAITRFPGERIGPWFPNVFDKVLLDAPCSMQGLRTAESHPSRPVTPKESSQLAARQTALLASALQAVRIGGEVVYSTCTLLPAEDEGVVDTTLRRFAGAIELLDAQKVLPFPAPGLSTLADHHYQAEMRYVIRLWPHLYQTAGFFACIIKKKENLGLPIQEPPHHSMEKAGYIVMSAKEERLFCDQFQDAFGFNLAGYLFSYNVTLVRHLNQVHLFPHLLLERFSGLPVQSGGLLLGEQTLDGFQPSFNWISRFGSCCNRNRISMDPETSSKWIRGENLPLESFTELDSGVYQIMLDESNNGLGCGKVTRDSIKNLLPRRIL